VDELLRLYVTRHGETIWNTQKRLQGWKDSDLTERGVKNALALGNRLSEVNFHTIYSSPSNRTMETARLIRGERKQHIIEDNNLREIHLGEWEGQTHEEIKEANPKGYGEFWEKPHLYSTASGENFYQLSSRVLNFLNRIQMEHNEGNILIVTHTVFIKALLAHCKNLPVGKLWNPPFIHDTSLSIIELRDGKRKVILEGDDSHCYKETK